MENPTYIALSRQIGLRRELDVVANNIANMSTTGFQRSTVLFTEYLKRPTDAPLFVDGQRNTIAFGLDAGSYRDTRQGPIEQTSNPLDLAIEGEGWFVLQGNEGPVYGRGGAFQLNAARQITDRNGYPLLGEGGPLTLPDDGGTLQVDADGTVLAGGTQVGRIRLVRFERPQEMQPILGGVFSAAEPAQPATEVRLVQGALEGSNVQPIVELTRMIELQRAYENNQRLVQAEHDRQRDAVSRIARLA